MSIVIKGVPNMVKIMEGIRAEMCTRASLRAVRAGGNVIRAAMVERTPEQEVRKASGNSLQVGELKADIHVKTTLKDGIAAAKIGPGKDTAHVARWVEYGHRMVSGGYSRLDRAGRLRGPGKASSVDVPAHPFLRPAVEASGAEAQAAMIETLNEGLRKAAKA